MASPDLDYYILTLTGGRARLFGPMDAHAKATAINDVADSRRPGAVAGDFHALIATGPGGHLTVYHPLTGKMLEAQPLPSRADLQFYPW